jgi:DNA-binding MarR family transcriptional regulator
MNYKLLTDLLLMVQQFESQQQTESYSADLQGFSRWLSGQSEQVPVQNEDFDYVGKDKGRSPDSVINTLFVHLNRYAKAYARAAIHGSPFSTPDDFIYLITLTAFGAMSKSALIRRNIHDKPMGIQIINRLIKNGWVVQVIAEDDKRSKIVSLTMQGAEVLNAYMDKIRIASGIVTGNLTDAEKVTLIKLLTKLDVFHQHIFESEVHVANLLESATLFKQQNNPV